MRVDFEGGLCRIQSRTADLSVISGYNSYCLVLSLRVTAGSTYPRPRKGYVSEVFGSLNGEDHMFEY